MQLYFYVTNIYCLIIYVCLPITFIQRTEGNASFKYFWLQYIRGVSIPLYMWTVCSRQTEDEWAPLLCVAPVLL